MGRKIQVSEILECTQIMMMTMTMTMMMMMMLMLLLLVVSSIFQYFPTDIG